jgi:hypothetical protein
MMALPPFALSAFRRWLISIVEEDQADTGWLAKVRYGQSGISMPEDRNERGIPRLLDGPVRIVTSFPKIGVVRVSA